MKKKLVVVAYLFGLFVAQLILALLEGGMGPGTTTIFAFLDLFGALAVMGIIAAGEQAEAVLANK